ncbi:MAG: hypothetical protein KIT43_14955 [Bauldia sp.]|nr:hypothetical protein [Bauldia sp.]
MRIRQVSYAAIVIAGGIGLAAGPAVAQPMQPPAIAPAMPPAPAVQPAAPPAMVEPAAPLGPIDGGRMMMPAVEGTGVHAEIMAIMMAQFHRMDTNGDGRLTTEEFAAGWESAFLLLDQNADGFLDDADRAIAARNLTAMAAEERADRAAAAGAQRDGQGAGERGAGYGRGEGHFEYRRGDGGGWGGHYEHHENGGGMFFFRFPGGMMHFFMMPFGNGGGMDGHGMPGGRDMPGGMGGMPFFFHGMPGFPGMQGMPGMQEMPGMQGMPGMPGGPNIRIQPMPGGGDRTGGGAGGWVAPGEDRAGGGTGGWVVPGQNGPAPAMPQGGNPREATPSPKP